MNIPIYITAGISTGLTVGGTAYVNSALAGKIFTLEVVDQGTLYPDTSDNAQPDYHNNPSGGFTLLQSGRTFQSGEKFVLTVISIAIAPQSYGTPKYTNGFDLAQVVPAMMKRLGWRQPTISGSPVLNADNLTSASGRYFQSFHSLVTLAKIKDVVEDKDISDADFNTYLSNLQNDAILRCLNEVFRMPELIEQKLLFTRFATMDQPVTNQGLFVGFLINTANDQSISTQINMATLYFNEDVSFNLYLFMDGVKAPLMQIPVSCTAYQNTEIDLESLVLNFKTGQKYYFGYFQSELGTAKAIRWQVDTIAKTCCFEAFCFQAPATDGNTDFNHDYRQYGYLPMGINLEMISFRDHTQKIIRKANLFDEAIGLQVAAMVVEEIVMTTRTNKDQRQITDDAGKIYADLNQAMATQEIPNMPGLKSRIAGEFKRLTATFFPPQQAISISQEIDVLGIESSWYRQNYRQITNPPIVKT